jgi:hypothetical protein
MMEQVKSEQMSQQFKSFFENREKSPAIGGNAMSLPNQGPSESSSPAWAAPESWVNSFLTANQGRSIWIR